jgi:hypothetical protein
MIQNDQTTPFLVKITSVTSMVPVALFHVLAIRHLITMFRLMVYTFLAMVHAIVVKKTMAEAIFVDEDEE